MSSRKLAMFYLGRLRKAPGHELLAVAGIAAGVALLFASLVINNTVSGSYKENARGVVGKANLEIVARGGKAFNQELYRRVEKLSSVKASAPVLEQRIGIESKTAQRPLTLVGIDERLPKLGGSLVKRFLKEGGRLPELGLYLPQEVANSLEVGAGDQVTVAAGASAKKTAVAEVLTRRDLGSLTKSPTTVAPLGLAQELLNKPALLSRIVILTKPGQAKQARREIKALLGDRLDLRSIDTESRLLETTAKPDRQTNQTFGLIGLLVGVLLTYNAMLLTLAERRAFVGTLRTLGASDAAVAATLLFDTLIVGLVGSALGVLVGYQLVTYVFNIVPTYLTFTFTIGSEVVVGPKIYVSAIAGGLLASLAAAARPISLVYRAGPWQLAKDDAHDGSGLLINKTLPLLGLALSIVAITLGLYIPELAIGGAVVLIAAMMMVLPTCVRYALKLIERVAERLGAAAMQIAVAELKATPARAIALSATGALAIFAILSLGGVAANLEDGRKKLTADIVGAPDLSIRPEGSGNLFPTDPFPSAAVVRRLQKRSEVSELQIYYGAYFDYGEHRMMVFAPSQNLPNPVISNQIRKGNRALVQTRLRSGRGWAAMTDSVAREHKLEPGDSFVLPTPSGQRRLRLAATVSDYGWIGGSLLINPRDFKRLWRSDQATWITVKLKNAVSPAEGLSAAWATITDFPGLGVETTEVSIEKLNANLEEALSHITQTSNLVLVAAMLAIVAMMLASIAQRRRRLEALVAIGIGPSQLYRALFLEVGSTLLVGCAIGTVFGFAGQGLAARNLQMVAASPAPFTPAWRLALVTAGLATLFAAIAVLFPTLRVFRLKDYHPSTE